MSLGRSLKIGAARALLSSLDGPTPGLDALWRSCVEPASRAAAKGCESRYRYATVLNFGVTIVPGPAIAKLKFKRHIEIRYLLV
jgi:hypothetical protein